jgi:hydantoinase/carbamoylase family amidase
MGSHLDTVPDGGAFDGALGVAAGVAAAGALTSASVDLPWALEIIAFVDEEGAYGSGTLGSRAMVGKLLPSETEATVDGSPKPLALAAEAVGFSAAGLAAAARPVADFVGYLELHIEQGPLLERSGTRIGIVTGIPSIHRYQIEIHGRADHAGTTPVSLRDDALRKSLDFMNKAHEILADSEGEMIGNLGNVVVQPGSFNVVPSSVTLALELRATDPELLARIAAQCSQWLVEIDPSGAITTLTKKSGVATDGRLREAIATAARAVGCSCREMPSGAGHDATSFAELVPTAMIFVPCREGKSHCADEFATHDAVADGANTLLQTILNLRGIG